MCVFCLSFNFNSSSWLDVARRKRSLPVYIQIHATCVGLLDVVTLSFGHGISSPESIPCILPFFLLSLSLSLFVKISRMLVVSTGTYVCLLSPLDGFFSR